jgi:hypothetical protein
MAVLCCGLEKNTWSERGMGAARAWYGKCESDTAALCKSNGKDTFYTPSGRAWQGNGMGAASYVLIGLYTDTTLISSTNTPSS